MYYVYILKSKKNKNKTYVGITRNLARRAVKHNLCTEKATKIYAPWKIESYIATENKKRAVRLEKYLKSGSGKAFLRRRLLS